MGNCFGGQAMAWMIACGSVSAHRFTRQKMILRFIDQISFINPVMLADRFSVKSQVNHCFHDSVEVGVRAETHSLGQASKHALSAYFIFETDQRLPIQYSLSPDTPADTRRNKEALGRKRVRIKREQLRVGHQPLSTEFTNKTKLGLMFLNISQLMRVYNRKLMKESWSIHYRSEYIEVATQQSMDKISVFRATSKTYADPTFVFEVLHDFTKWRRKWDMVYQGGKIVETIDDSNDIIHLIMKTKDTKLNDFCLLRSWRQTAPGVCLISFRSVKHPKLPEDPRYTRANVLSSGYVIKTKTTRQKIKKICFASGSLGITFKGLRVYSLVADGQAKRLGVKKGWLLTHVGSNIVRDQSDLKEEIEKKKRKSFTITFCYGKDTPVLTLPRLKGDKKDKKRIPPGQKEICELTYIVQFQDQAFELAMGDVVGYNRVIVRSFEKLRKLLPTGGQQHIADGNKSTLRS
mmetsp:Transcript_3420/g.5308  ORF Transcript_3420/g.5308 Transcript_3420/m.5308 type:complete len:462 (+) Transcript_3420:281-1666(+)